MDFSSNDYLRFGAEPWRPIFNQPANPKTNEELMPPASASAMSQSGHASRLLRGHHPIWDEVEQSLAEWHGAEAALMFTSGYAANEGLLATAIEPHDFVASDELNHASIVDGLRLGKAERFVFRHNDLEHLESGLRAAALSRGTNRQLFVATESLFGMEGDRAPLVELAALCEKHRAHLIVDEAHATGCFGPTGSGLVDEVRLRRRILASVHTGGKALGVIGAYVCGSARLREILINRCRHFIFTTALPPMIGGGWLAALKRVKAAAEQRRRLHESAAFFRRELRRHGVSACGQDYIVPVIVGDDARAVTTAQRLQAAGWDVRPIRPPSVPEGTARLRISIHADHDTGTLTKLACAVAEVAGPVSAGVP
jgi:8-amino-7-oxononanoate synthase